MGGMGYCYMRSTTVTVGNRQLITHETHQCGEKMGSTGIPVVPISHTKDFGARFNLVAFSDRFSSRQISKR